MSYTVVNKDDLQRLGDGFTWTATDNKIGPVQVNYEYEAVTATTATSNPEIVKLHVSRSKLSHPPTAGHYRTVYRDPPEGTLCAHCGTTEGVKLEDSRTQYPPMKYSFWAAVMYDDDKLPDPNAPIPLCRECAVEHHEHWDEQWRDFYWGQF